MLRTAVRRERKRKTEGREAGPFADNFSFALFRDEKQVGAIGARAETLFIRVSLKSRFSERLSPLSQMHARADLGAFCTSLHEAQRRLLYAFLSRRRPVVQTRRSVGRFAKLDTTTAPIHPRFHAKIVPTLS